MDNLLQLGKYRLVEKIGEGGYGSVYLAEDAESGKKAAVKVLHSRMLLSPEMMGRFQREYRLAGELQHQNIVRMLDAGQDNGCFYLAMEYLEGGSLAERLQDGTPLALDAVVDLLEPLAEALDFAHSRGIIHRDIKPSNILFNRLGRPVLTDFGLVKSLDQPGVSSSGETMGTAEYMAPELIQGDTSNPSADRYSLAVMAYRMLTGKVPFEDTSQFKVQEAHVHTPLPNPRRFNPQLQPEAAQVLMRALQKEPARRHSSAVEFVAALREVLQRERQEQARAALAQAQQSVEARDFDRALEAIETAQTLHSDTQTQRLYESVLEQQSAMKEYGKLRHEESEAQAKIADLLKKHPWLAPQAPTKPTGKAEPQPRPDLKRAVLVQTGILAAALIVGHLSLTAVLAIFDRRLSLVENGVVNMSNFISSPFTTVSLPLFINFILLAVAVALALNSLKKLAQIGLMLAGRGTVDL